ncbi:MAG: LolA-like protein, partial [Candidatus Acidiferrales bacterium]
RTASMKCAKLNQVHADAEAALRRSPRILFGIMPHTARSRAFCSNIVLRCAFLVGALFLSRAVCSAQQGPLTPPPDHDVHRIGTEPVPPAPPSIPPEEIIKRFSQKEDEYIAARAGYSYKKTVRLEEFGPDGKLSGELSLVIEGKPGADGKMYEKTVERPQSTLHYLEMGPEDFQSLARMPAFPLTTSQLAKYDLKYLGKELVDEINCYIFQVKPKAVERAHYYFDGIVWVDDAYLEVVKTYGKWVNDLGDMRSPTMPFSIFETYRENVDGKYWLPDYMRSDDTLNLKDINVPVRLVIKWTDYKPLAAATPAPAAAQPAAPPKPQP